MDMDNLYRQDNQKMVGSKEILFYSKTRRGIISEVVAYWLEKFKGLKVFILGIAYIIKKVIRSTWATFLISGISKAPGGALSLSVF